MQVVLGTREADWQTVMDITLTRVFLSSKYGICQIVESGGGSIVNVSSIGGMREMFDPHTYSTATTVTVNCVAPGGIDTEMISS